MVTAKARDLMSVAELAKLLFVSKTYVRKKLLRKHTLRPVTVRRGRKFVLRAKADAYRRKRQRIARRALRELARTSQEVGLYDNTKMDR
jgi:excisionase family DNA binding protein